MDERFERREREPEPRLADIIDGAAKRISTGLLLGGAAIALAIYSRPGPPRYEVDVMGSTVIRTNTRTGGVYACEGRRCYVLIQRGSRRGNSPVPEVAPAQPAQQQKALPSPARPQPTPGNAQ